MLVLSRYNQSDRFRFIALCVGVLKFPSLSTAYCPLQETNSSVVEQIDLRSRNRLHTVVAWWSPTVDVILHLPILQAR
ncbi:hypothetical protein B0T26DRAFT_478880 [Lasiosphaeria miniovina]|uniref:Uncharacterized protein n=1 Tax=Lasiosphaeria miniovina TaxID=1954250 RepID=A0AA40A064_9PEZI|nr:uncharacterized protein B0T26DRAFT_478880 [Lasiosphaeria miniovina]KAK0706892.1 hypothetical protein B0T26DRAFT_478880 [Lasiosphaeria miniovina]